MEVEINNHTFLVKIIRKDNKNLYLRVNENKEIVVTANRFFSEKEILKIINENTKAILRMAKKQDNKIKRDNETIIWGKSYCLVIDDDIKEVIIDDNFIYAKDKNMLSKYITAEIKKVFESEVNKIKRDFINVPDFTLKIRKMKTRWGVCNYVKRTVTLNSELVKYDIKLLDYVIVHELAHFTHHDHSKNFWKLVESYYPDYKKARKELNE